jgi:HD-GYP domain-containing protein (c-di-GMP phosphodiesterase class II)
MAIDTLDAITSDRPYRKGESLDIAKNEIKRMSGSQIDPLAVDVFFEEEKALPEMVLNKCQMNPNI